MRFLVDECTGPAVAKWLSKQGYEIFSVYDQARGLDDDGIMEKAFVENWILITNDKDFGEKVFRERRPHRGIIFLRLEDERSDSKIDIISSLLSNYKDQLPENFTVVTETKVRFARSSHFNKN